jgi:adenylate kinase
MKDLRREQVVYAAAGAASNTLGALDENAPIPAVILFGAPGSGKGTQARLLRERCINGPHISTGDMLRRHIQAKDQIGLEIRDLMKAGRLVSDQLVNQLVDQRIQEPDCRGGFILDGYPRTVNQAMVLREMVARYEVDPAVVHLFVDYEKLVARLSGRRQCPVCGTLYSLATNPPKVAGICDRDGAVLVTREDDREEVIRERLRQYDLETRPVLDYFRASGVPMVEIEGAGASPEAIVEAICDRLAGQGRATK